MNASERSAFAKSTIIPVLKKVSTKMQFDIEVYCYENVLNPIQVIIFTDTLVKISFKITTNKDIPTLIIMLL